MKKVAVYVDGFNLISCASGSSRSTANHLADKSKIERHRTYIKALHSKDVKFVEAKFKRTYFP